MSVPARNLKPLTGVNHDVNVNGEYIILPVSSQHTGRLRQK
jgi:hypothetical protein